MVVGIPTLRLDGMFAAVTTLAFSLAASGYLLVREEFSWIPQAQLGTPYLFGIAITSQSAVFELCLGVLVLVLIALHGLRHSRTGRVLRALPANQRAAAGYGVRVVRAKLTAFAVSGFIAGLAGCLLLVVNQQYEETSFLVPVSLIVFTSTAVGGLGSAFGAILGAAIVEGSAVYLPPSWQLFPVRTRRAARPHPLPSRAGRPLLRPARLGPRGAGPPTRDRGAGVARPIEGALAP